MKIKSVIKKKKKNKRVSDYGAFQWFIMNLKSKLLNYKIINWNCACLGCQSTVFQLGGKKRLANSAKL